MQKIKSALKSFWADESGQGATEYILLLVVVVAIAMLFKERIKEAIGQKMAQLSEQIQGFTGD